jgi:hypothetical protein
LVAALSRVLFNKCLVVISTWCEHAKGETGAGKRAVNVLLYVSHGYGYGVCFPNQQAAAAPSVSITITVVSVSSVGMAFHQNLDPQTNIRIISLGLMALFGAR